MIGLRIPRHRLRLVLAVGAFAVAAAAMAVLSRRPQPVALIDTDAPWPSEVGNGRTATVDLSPKGAGNGSERDASAGNQN